MTNYVAAYLLEEAWGEVRRLERKLANIQEHIVEELAVPSLPIEARDEFIRLLAWIGDIDG